MGRKVTFHDPLVTNSSSKTSFNCKKMEGLVVKAIQDMKEPQGSSAHSILKYVQNELKGTEVGSDTQKIAEMLRKALNSGIRGVFVYKLKSGKYKLVQMKAGDKSKRPRRCRCCRKSKPRKKRSKKRRPKPRRRRPKPKRRSKPKRRKPKRRSKPKRRRSKPKPKRRRRPKRKPRRRCRPKRTRKGVTYPTPNCP